MSIVSSLKLTASMVVGCLVDHIYICTFHGFLLQVEIRCMGEAVTPTLKLQKLVDLWLRRSSKRQRVNAWSGSSAKDYMMVLVYGRSATTKGLT